MLPWQQTTSQQLKLLRSFSKIPIAPFPRENPRIYFHPRRRAPIISPGKTYYPRTDERWLKAPIGSWLRYFVSPKWGEHTGIDSIVRCLYTKNNFIMPVLRCYTSFPMTLFRAKTQQFASLWAAEQPRVPPTTMCYPRNNERWSKAPPAQGFGISLLTNGEKIRALRNIKYVYVFEEGLSIPQKSNFL